MQNPAPDDRDLAMAMLAPGRLSKHGR